MKARCPLGSVPTRCSEGGLGTITQGKLELNRAAILPGPSITVCNNIGRIEGKDPGRSTMAIRKGPRLHNVRWMALVGWTLVSVRYQGLVRSAALDDVQYEVPLEPFQILLYYDNNDPMAMSDEMMVLNSTQSYLTSRLREREPNFSSLFLYQFVRDYVAYSQDHFSKIAMNGIAYFDFPMSASRQKEVQGQVMDSLMGEKGVQYVDFLYSNGMTHVVNATLLSIQGNEIVYREGQIVESSNGLEDQGNDELENTRDMDDDDMRMMTLLLCLLVPGIAMLIAATVYACRSAREINWKHTNLKTAELQSTWKSREFRVTDSRLPTSHRARKVGHEHESAGTPKEICKMRPSN